MVGVCAGCCAGWWPSWAASWAQARGTRKGQGHRTPLPPPLWCVLGRFIMDAERAVAQAGRMHRPACCTARSGVCTHAATTVRAASMVGGRWLGRWCMPGCCRWWCEQGRTTWPGPSYRAQDTGQATVRAPCTVGAHEPAHVLHSTAGRMLACCGRCARGVVGLVQDKGAGGVLCPPLWCRWWCCCRWRRLRCAQ